MRLLVIDGNSIANRAFFGIKLLTTKDGRYTNAIYGFLNILLSLLKECDPDEVAVAFDLKAPTFRHKMYDGYKATRHGMPEELAQQMPVLKELLADLGYREVTAEGWEADDILGTLAAACDARKDDCFLATGDRDSLQLVSESTTVLLATTAMGRSKTVAMDVAAIEEKYGIQPRQLIEVKSLMGDTSDNIPGVRGIGEKTALALVQKFGTLENVYANIDDKTIKPKQREHLLECKADAELSHLLGTIRTDAPIDTAEGAYKVGEGNKAAAVKLLQELEIHSLIPRFGLDGVAPAADPETLPAVEGTVDVLPLTPSGHYLLAARPAVTGKQGTKNVVLQPEAWYAVQDTTVYPLSDDALVRLLDDPAVTLDVFDSAPLYALAMAHGGWGSSIVWDGKLAAYLLDASASKYQVSELLTSYKAQAAFTCEAWPDAGSLADLFARMKAEITARDEDALYNDIEFPLAQVLADMTRTGILVDRDGIEAFGLRMRSELSEVLARIQMETGSTSFNPNSPKQLGEMLFDTMGLPHGKKTQRGWSTDAETLESLREYPLVEDVLQYRAYQKLNSTYVEGLLKVIGEDGRIHSTFNQTEARTGRLSSDNPNLQNIPVREEMGRRIRRAFIPSDEEHLLLSADYSQVELRLMAHLSGDESLIAAFAHGEDIHAATAAKLFNKTLDEVTSEERRRAKTANFGIIYGISVFGLAERLSIPRAESKELIEGYFKTYPDIRAYMDESIEVAKEKGYVETIYKRKRFLPDINSHNAIVRGYAERNAINAPIQGSAADIIKVAMVRIFNRFETEGLKSKMILQVHDELNFNVYKDELEKVKQIVLDEMENAIKLQVPLIADCGEGVNWLEAH